MQTSVTNSLKLAEESQLDSTASASDIDRLLANPSDYFDYSLTRMMGLSREHLDRLQIEGLKRRFDQFRGSLPILDRLADSQGIDAIERLDDVLPLLFGHEIYKSYPASLLDKHHFAQLTAWLNKFTTVDLSKVDVSACRSIDDWLITLNRETQMAVVHTSGTSGTMSFLPATKSDWRRYVEQFVTLYFQRFGQESPGPRVPLNIECIYPFFRHGGLSHIAINDAAAEVIAGGEKRFHTAYPGRLSADLLLLAAKRRAAEAKGQLDKLEINPELSARREEFEAQQRDMPRHVAAFFDTLRTQLSGEQVFMVSASHMLYSLAVDGIKQGMRWIFSSESVIATGGGGKGMLLPDNWQETIKEFFGAENLCLVYGMTEMLCPFTSCEQGHYHSGPWVIPFILDPETNQLLPRKGIVTGRFAFYDLLPDTRWGGFISGDYVTFDWDTCCPCGRTTPFITGKIQRISEIKADEGEEKINCAAAPEDYAKALEFLTEDNVSNSQGG